MRQIKSESLCASEWEFYLRTRSESETTRKPCGWTQWRPCQRCSLRLHEVAVERRCAFPTSWTFSAPRGFRWSSKKNIPPCYTTSTEFQFETFAEHLTPPEQALFRFARKVKIAAWSHAIDFFFCDCSTLSSYPSLWQRWRSCCNCSRGRHILCNIIHQKGSTGILRMGSATYGEKKTTDNLPVQPSDCKVCLKAPVRQMRQQPRWLIELTEDDRLKCI